MNVETVNELIQSLESAGELSIKETKVMALAKAYQQLAAENVAMKSNAIKARRVIMSSKFDYWSDRVELFEVVRLIIETPATDRIVAAQRSAFVDEAVAKITESGALTFGDCIVALCQLREGDK
ncbi:hypothetical protein AB4W76_22170 [Klebsiella pasteurii]|uniref:hypothetical protein n=1 Tax=Klebsiella pasteurii TaxID=2587529 RepID=UPI003AB4196C